MSTTFGILKNNVNPPIDDEDYTLDEESYIEVAFRGNRHPIRFTNELAQYLGDDIKVYPLDNSAQGIYTIGDIKNQIERNEFVRKNTI